jgi:flagellar motor switch protein FliM
MGALSEEQVETAARPAGAQKIVGKKPRSVQLCNFRSAGKLSNENARVLTALHEGFARHLTTALDAYLGSGVKVKLAALDQVSVKEHLDCIPPFAYIVPFSLNVIPSTMILEFDTKLALPIIDMLLGGTGMAGETREPAEACELSEIEEEIMQDLISLIARQAEVGWGVPSMSLVAKRRIEVLALQQLCPPNERITVVKFEVEVAQLTGSFHIIFPPCSSTF